jgi:hypothetical protein
VPTHDRDQYDFNWRTNFCKCQKSTNFGLVSPALSCGFGTYGSGGTSNWTWPNRKGDRCVVYLVGYVVETGNIRWTFGGASGGEPIDMSLLFDFGWGRTLNWMAADEAPACASRRASGAEPVVVDFEVEPSQILDNEGRGGSWLGFDDGTKGELYREEIEANGTEGRSRVLHVASSGFWKWGAGFGVGLHSETNANYGCAYDASAYSGVRIRARGRGRLRLMLADAKTTPTEQGGTCTRVDTKCFDRSGVSIDLAEHWTTFEFPFCTLVPQGWSGSTEGVEPTKLLRLQFVAGPREDVEVWLDDLAFYRITDGAPAPRCGPLCPLDAAPATARIEPPFSTAMLTNELRVHTFEQTTRSCGALTRRYLSFVPVPWDRVRRHPY